MCRLPFKAASWLPPRSPQRIQASRTWRRGFTSTAVIKPDPAELAKLSLQLAETFRKVEKAVSAAAGPQNVGYNVELADMAKWDK